MLNPPRPSLRGQGWRGSRPDITWELELERSCTPRLVFFSFLTCVFKLSFYRFLFYYFFFPFPFSIPLPNISASPQAGQPRWNAAGLHPRVPGAALLLGWMRLGLARQELLGRGQAGAHPQ